MEDWKGSQRELDYRNSHTMIYISKVTAIRLKRCSKTNQSYDKIITRMLNKLREISRLNKAAAAADEND